MAIENKNDGGSYTDEAGNRKGMLVVKSINTDSSGAAQTGLPPGRAAAAASVPTVLSTEDKAALDKAGGVYRRAAAVGATAGDGVFVQGVTTAGPITVTLAGGGSLTVNVPLGSTLLPFAATAVAMGSTGGTAQSLFFS